MEVTKAAREMALTKQKPGMRGLLTKLGFLFVGDWLLMVYSIDRSYVLSCLTPLNERRLFCVQSEG